MFVAKRYFRDSRLFLPKYKKHLELCASNDSIDINKPAHNPHNPLNECEKTLVNKQALSCKNITNCAFYRENPLNECEKSKSECVKKVD